MKIISSKAENEYEKIIVKQEAIIEYQKRVIECYEKHRLDLEFSSDKMDCEIEALNKELEKMKQREDVLTLARKKNFTFEEIVNLSMFPGLTIEKARWIICKFMDKIPHGKYGNSVACFIKALEDIHFIDKNCGILGNKAAYARVLKSLGYEFIDSRTLQHGYEWMFSNKKESQKLISEIKSELSSYLVNK